MIQIPKEKAVAYLDKTSLRIYSPKLGKIVAAQFPANVICDIELIDDEMFNLFMKAFLDQQHLPPHQVALILSPAVVFEKKLLAQGIVARAEEIQRFNEAVPFNEVSSKQYTTDGITYVAATNNDLVNAFKGFFKRNGWYITTVFPLESLGKPYSVKPDIDIETMQFVLKKFDEEKQLDMSDLDDMAPVSYFRLDTNPNNQQSKKTLPVLVSVFAVLLGVLGFLVYSQQSAQVPVKASISPTAQPTLPVATDEAGILAPSQPAGSSSAALVRAGLSIRIINSSGNSQSGTEVAKQLQALGYTNVTVGAGPVVNGRPILIFQKSVPAGDRTPLSQSLDAALGGISVQEAEVASYEATITLTKP